MKTIAITGISGFVGTNLKNYFTNLGFKVIGIKREVIKDQSRLDSIIENSDIVINLAGANIINRWSESYKKLLYDSRIDTTKALVRSMTNVSKKPELFISTSAVGIYKNKRSYNEEDYEYEEGFLANLCKDWENEALKAKSLNIRTIIFRFGIVLGKEGGALSKMMTPFKLGLGGPIGDGSQAFSFIHIDDLVQAYEFIISNEKCNGVYNLTAPKSTTNLGLTKALGKALNRPTVIPLPVFVLNLIFGEGAKVLSDGQSVFPKRLLDSGFEFRYKNIDETIKSLV